MVYQLSIYISINRSIMLYYIHLYIYQYLIAIYKIKKLYEFMLYFLSIYISINRLIILFYIYLSINTLLLPIKFKKLYTNQSINLFIYLINRLISRSNLHLSIYEYLIAIYGIKELYKFMLYQLSIYISIHRSFYFIYIDL